MRAYGYKRGSDYYAPYGTCRKCGWTGKDWGFRYHGYCKKCHAQWRKEKAEEQWRLKLPNENIEVADGIIVTRNVRKRLEKKAKQDVPITIKEIIFISILILSGLISWISFTIFLMVRDSSTGTCAFLSFIVAFICGWIGLDETGKRICKVDARLEELARERQKRIDEATGFYGSPEWRILREQVIKEQGRLCQECSRQIKDDYDLTVDHIKPRSKYPELALEKSNLQVLCRKCNSAKGAIYNEATISAQFTVQ